MLGERSKMLGERSKMLGERSKMLGERFDDLCVQSFLPVRFVVIDHPLNNSNASLQSCDCSRTLSLS